MASWLDSHSHINDDDFNEDLNEVLDKMVLNDVNRCMIVSLNVASYLKAKEIKDERIEFKKAIGIYPEDTNLTEEEMNEIFKYYEEADAIGEIGLDYHWYKDTKEKQKELFIRQIEMANRLNKPVIIHAREAIQDTYDILKKHPCKAVLHCYSGSAEMAKEFTKLGYYISFAGPTTFKNAKEPIEVAKSIPIDRLLIETDSPYLSPVPNRGKRNDPSNVIYIGKLIAKELGIDEEILKEQINKNYDALFTQ